HRRDRPLSAGGDRERGGHRCEPRRGPRHAPVPDDAAGVALVGRGRHAEDRRAEGGPPRETPRCRLVRIAADLSVDDGRRAALAECVATARRAIVLTEGVLTYLSLKDVAKLADDVHAQAAIES